MAEQNPPQSSKNKNARWIELTVKCFGITWVLLNPQEPLRMIYLLIFALLWSAEIMQLIRSKKCNFCMSVALF